MRFHRVMLHLCVMLDHRVVLHHGVVLDHRLMFHLLIMCHRGWRCGKSRRRHCDRDYGDDGGYAGNFHRDLLWRLVGGNTVNRLPQKGNW